MHFYLILLMVPSMVGMIELKLITIVDDNNYQPVNPCGCTSQRIDGLSVLTRVRGYQISA